ncbi:hypothetical protein GQ53DRAFT_122346 [Thozetella sp. PMI_491]|nr:hypothetical protein GQ53DRAFT_122346 [Thozetella sp. PMI_491]
MGGATRLERQSPTRTGEYLMAISDASPALERQTNKSPAHSPISRSQEVCHALSQRTARYVGHPSMGRDFLQKW